MIGEKTDSRLVRETSGGVHTRTKAALFQRKTAAMIEREIMAVVFF